MRKTQNTKCRCNNSYPNRTISLTKKKKKKKKKRSISLTETICEDKTQHRCNFKKRDATFTTFSQ